MTSLFKIELFGTDMGTRGVIPGARVRTVRAADAGEAVRVVLREHLPTVDIARVRPLRDGWGYDEIADVVVDEPQNRTGERTIGTVRREAGSEIA